MDSKKKRIVTNQVALGLLFVILSILLVTTLPFSEFSVLAANISNSTVSTRVNIVNNTPFFTSHQIDPDPVDLNPGSLTNVTCNGTVIDFDGWEDITNVSVQLFDASVGGGLTTDNNFRYVNQSCNFNSTHACTQASSSPFNATCSCTFSVEYYANPGSWQCNMTIMDGFGVTVSNLSSLGTISPIVAIETPPQIDFGNLSVTEISHTVRENITNLGNVPLNVSVRGFGGDVEDSVTRNLSMVCSGPGAGDIAPSFERFSLINTTPFDSMLNISNTSQVLNLTIPKREDDSQLGNSTNATFWRLQVPLGAGGFCNGTVIFGAIDGS